MGQEYSGQNITSVSYPEAVGYIRKGRGKKNKYPLSKVEIASFSKIPYSKYVPLDNRNSTTYKRSLHSHSPTRQVNARDCKSAPAGRNSKSVNKGKSIPNSAAPSKGRNTVTQHASKSNNNNTSVHDTSVLSNSSAGTGSISTSVLSSKKSVQSPNTSLVSVKEGKKKEKRESKGQNGKFVPRNDKEIQLSKIYIKPQDLVLEKPKKTKKKGKKGEEKKEKKSNKQKALFRIRKKTRVEPTPVYLESPFKRQTTIRIKRSQVAPHVGNKSTNSVQNQRTVSRESHGVSLAGSDLRVPHRSRSPVKDSGYGAPRRSRSPVKSVPIELDVIGTKSHLFERDENSKPDTPELEALFTKRTRSQSPLKPRIDRPQTVSEIRHLPSTIKSRPTERPQSSPYNVAPYAGGGTIYPGYRGKENRAPSQGNNTRGKKASTANRKNKRSAIAPMSSKIGNKGKIQIVKGKKSDPKVASEPKVRLKWFNVLHRSHYQNRIDSIYDKQQGDREYVTDHEHGLVGEDNEWKTECGSLNTYSDSFLTNTTLSTANATVVGELDRNSTEVEYEPSEITIVNSETSTLVNDYEGDGETDLDKPLRFKHKKSPELLRKDLLKMQESYFRNHPGVEEETDTDTDASTITETYPSAGHVDKMRRLFGVITDNGQQSKARQGTIQSANNIFRMPHRDKEKPYQPSFINQNNPAHLFQAKGQDNKEPVVMEDKSAKNVKVPNSRISVAVVKGGQNRPKVPEKTHNKPVMKAPVFSAKPPAIGHSKGKSPTFLTQNISASKNKEEKTKGVVSNGRSTYYCAEVDKKTANKPKELPVFLLPTSESNRDQKTKRKPAGTEAKRSIIDVIAREETNDLLQEQKATKQHDSDTDSLAELDDAAAMAVKQQQNVRRVEVQEVKYNGDINASLNQLWDKQHDGDAPQKPPVATPKSSKPLQTPVYRTGEIEEEMMSPGCPEINKGSEQIILVQPLNPVHTYKKDVYSYSAVDNPGNRDKRRSTDFTAKRDFFENKEPQATIGIMAATTNDAVGVPEQPLVNSMEMSPEQTVTIDGNYDSYARESKYPTKKFVEVPKTTTTGDKEGIRLPKIVDQSTFSIYSRHGPVHSTGLPSQAKQKQGVMGLYSGPTPATTTAKGSRYSAYTWKNWS